MNQMYQSFVCITCHLLQKDSVRITPKSITTPTFQRVASSALANWSSTIYISHISHIFTISSLYIPTPKQNPTKPFSDQIRIQEMTSSCSGLLPCHPMSLCQGACTSWWCIFRFVPAESWCAMGIYSWSTHDHSSGWTMIIVITRKLQCNKIMSFFDNCGVFNVLPDVLQLGQGMLVEGSRFQALIVWPWQACVRCQGVWQPCLLQDGRHQFGRQCKSGQWCDSSLFKWHDRLVLSGNSTFFKYI